MSGTGPDFVLMLGDFAFGSMEVPDEITETIEQAIVVHQYPGGSRTVDAMGPKPGDISWSGHLMDGNAEARWSMLHQMASAGVPLTLSYASRQVNVIVSKVERRFQRFYQIPYSIAMTVVEDLSQPLVATSADLDQVILLDALAVDALVNIISEALTALRVEQAAIRFYFGLADTIQTLISDLIELLKIATNNVLSAITAAGSPSQATVDQVLAIANAAQAAQTLAKQLAYNAEISIIQTSDPALFGPGVDPLFMVGSVDALVAAGVIVPAAQDCSNRLGRLTYNLSTIEG